MKKRGLTILAIVIALVGCIWFGQGVGWIGGSVMTNETQWAVIGGIMIVAAAGLFWFAMSRKS